MNRREASAVDALDKRYAWHPFTQMKEWCEGPIVVIDRAQGNWLIDTRGRRYLDGVSSLWCNVHGHRVPSIDRAVRAQLGRVAHSTFLGLSNVPAARLAEKLVKLAPPGLERVFYADSGSACVEVALKMAFQYWQLKGEKTKKTFLRLKNAYHGDTLGSVSVGGIALFHEIFSPLLFHTYQAQAPYAYRDAFRGSESEYARHCAAKVEAVLKKHHRQIAALIVEPLMQGAAGMLKQPKGYLAALRRLTQKYRVLLIADEVATGFGRTGKMFACEHEQVSPDFLCTAKGLTGGYLPLSATLTTDKVYRAFLGAYSDFKAFFHGHTYSANPLAAAAALANIELFQKRRTLEALPAVIDVMSAELGRLARLEAVGDVRQAGLMAGIELVENKKTRKPYPLAEKTGIRVCLEARKKGVLLRPLGNVIVFMPPLSITQDELRLLGRVTAECIQAVTGRAVAS